MRPVACTCYHSLRNHHIKATEQGVQLFNAHLYSPFLAKTCSLKSLSVRSDPFSRFAKGVVSSSSVYMMRVLRVSPRWGTGLWFCWMGICLCCSASGEGAWLFFMLLDLELFGVVRGRRLRLEKRKREKSTNAAAPRESELDYLSNGKCIGNFL